MRPQKRRRSASWPTSWMSVSPAPTWRRRSHAASPAAQSTSTADPTLSHERAMTSFIVVLNAGSSSIKFAVHGSDDGPADYRGQIEAIGISPALKVRDRAGTVVAEHVWKAADMTHEAATRELVRVIVGLVGQEKITAVGHRVVHGG